MYRQLILEDFLEKELIRYTALSKKMESDFKKLPKGSLILKDSRTYRVIKQDNKLRQIRLHTDSAPDRITISQLKYKRYIKTALPILKAKIKAIRKLQNSDPLYDPLQIQSTLSRQYQGLQNLPVFLEDDVTYECWEPEAAPPMFTDNLKHPSKIGLLTRSKAEAMIASQLEETDLKFQYEAEVRLTYRTVRPDFKILLPGGRRFIYWEHLGKLDDSEYVIDNLAKLQDYADAGIYLGINLILTCETKEWPLTYDTIRRTIDRIRNM